MESKICVATNFNFCISTIDNIFYQNLLIICNEMKIRKHIEILIFEKFKEIIIDILAQEEFMNYKYSQLSIAILNTLLVDVQKNGIYSSFPTTEF